MSWFTNIISGGGHNKLQNELDDLNRLKEFAAEMSIVYSDLQQQKGSATRIIIKERADAIRNINMAKTLMKRIKTKTESKTKQELVKDFNLEIEATTLEHNNSDLNFSFDENINAFTKTISTTLNSSINKSLSNLEKRNDFSKSSLKNEAKNIGAALTASALINGVTEVVNINKQINTKRREVKNQLEASHKYIVHLYDEIPKIIAFIELSTEISIVLNKTNQIFTKKYKEIHEILFEKVSVKTFLNDKIICDNRGDLKKVNTLMIVCSEYSKINKKARINR